LRPSRKSRSLVWKNWSRIQLFDTLTKRFKETGDDQSNDQSTLEKINKRKKASLTLSDFSKHFNYRSMRNKAAKIYRKKNPTQGIDKNENEAATET
jgi:hypothetical protein